MLSLIAFFPPGPEERACNLKGNCEACLTGNSSINLECYWCDKPSTRSGPKCRHYTFNSAIPVDGIECEDLMYKYASCRCKLCRLVTLQCTLTFPTHLPFIYFLLPLTPFPLLFPSLSPLFFPSSSSKRPCGSDPDHSLLSDSPHHHLLRILLLLFLLCTETTTVCLYIDTLEYHTICRYSSCIGINIMPSLS